MGPRLAALQRGAETLDEGVNQMKWRHFALVPALVLIIVTSGPVLAATELAGTMGGGAHFKIVVPDLWNGDLVIWNHGFSLVPVGPVTDLGPLAELQLSEGYAIAASSYRQNGWAVFKTKNDFQELVGLFKDHFGRPGAIIVTGASLGGIVTASVLEEVHSGNIVGALTVCGAMAGSRNWDGALDLRLVYDAVCGTVPGAAIPGGAEGLPEGSTLDGTGLATAVNACTGIFLPSAARSPEQTERLARILDVTKLPESFLLTDMGFATFAMSNLVHENGKLNGKIGTGNASVDYGDPLINASIERVSPNHGAANRLERHFIPTGEVRGAKIVSLHTDKDGLVVVENESEYGSVVPPQDLTTAIVVEAAPTHCGFTAGEIVAGWESLRGWVAGGPQPSAASIQGTCLGIVAGGLAAGPCRIDPTFVVPDMDGRIRPR